MSTLILKRLKKDPHPPLAAPAGFTLLEIMIAVAITGGLLVTLLSTLNYHLGLVERHEFLTVATLLAKEKMAEIRKNPLDSKGSFPQPYSQYQFLTEVKESSYPNMISISITVTDGRERIRLVELYRRGR